MQEEKQQEDMLEGEEGAKAEGSAPSPEELAAQKDAEIAELKSQTLYLRADFDNTKKRLEKRYREALEYATEPLLKDLLPVLDNLEKALEHAKEGGPESFSGLVEGLEMVVGQFQGTLSRHGVEDVLAHGEKFDPNFHDALTQVPGEEENRVAQVFEKGYRLKGRLLRPAKVAVSKVATRGSDG